MRIVMVVWGVVLIMLFTGAVSAADVSGKWKADSPRETVFDVKVDGNKLTGTVSMGGGELQSSEGQINGDEISFVVIREAGGNQMKMQYKGEVSEDEMKLNLQAGSRSFDVVAKRI